MSSNNLAGNRNSTPEGTSTLRPPSSRQIGSGHSLRASADMAAFPSHVLPGRGIRPSSEVYFNQSGSGQGQNPEDVDKATAQWLADIDQYEATLEEMATATLDQDFKDELSAIEQWFRVLSEAERTSALYALLQQTTQVQIRFFIQVLTQMDQNHPVSDTTKLNDAMSKLNVEGSRNSFASVRPPPSPGNKRFSGLDPSIISSMFPDAAKAIAKQKEQFTQHTGMAPPSTRNSIIGDRSSLVGDRSSLVGDRNSLAAPTISAPDDKKDAPSSPWLSRTTDAQRPKSSSSHAPMGQFTQPPPSAGLRSPRPPNIQSDTNLQSTTLNAPEPNALPLLSPYHGSGNWASMVNTPMVPNFNTQQGSNQVDMVANATAMKLQALSTVNNRIQFDDARKYRRARSSEGNGQPGTPGLPTNLFLTNEHGQMLTPQQAAALQAQQLAAMNARRSRPNSPGVFVSGAPNLNAMGFAQTPQNANFLSAYNDTPGLAGINLGQFGLGDQYVDHNEHQRGRSPRGRRGSSKPPEDPIDINLLNNIPEWLRSLRLHKYTDNLKGFTWQQLIVLTHDDLIKHGVAATGARNKLIKVFDQVKEAQAEGKLPA